MAEAQIDGDQETSTAALAQLSRRFHAVLLRYFIRRGIPVHDAQDLSQDLFARLSRRETLGDIEALEGFIFAMAANASIDYFRRSRVRNDGMVALEQVSDRGRDFSPERLLEGREELAAILATLNEMPERMRHIFVLARLENMKRQEIAERLGISRSLVDQQLALATACLADRRRRLA